MVDSDMSIHHNTDAASWAKCFCQTIKNHPEIVIDESYMEGWFSNAMMAIHDSVIKSYTISNR